MVLEWFEKGAYFGGNIAYENFNASAAGTGMIGRRGGGGGFIMGIGGKVMAKREFLKNWFHAATNVGKISRTGKDWVLQPRQYKMLGGLGKKAGAKLGGKAIGKVAGGAIAKSLGKKISMVGLGLGAVFAAQRAMQGDFLGAGLELASGAASTVPGIGTAGSVGIDDASRRSDDDGRWWYLDGAANAILAEETMQV